MIDVFNRLIGPVRLRVVNMVARAVVKVINDQKKLQLLQLEVTDGEIREDVERFQNYGFTSVPKDGAEAVIVRVGGNSDHGIVICVDDRRYRIGNLESGEVAVYDATGSTIVLKKNGDIEVTPSSGNAKLDCDVEITGDLKCDGDATVSGDTNCDGTVTGSTDVVGGSTNVSLKGHKHSGSTLTTTATVSTGSAGTVSGDTGVPD